MNFLSDRVADQIHGIAHESTLRPQRGGDHRQRNRQRRREWGHRQRDGLRRRGRAHGIARRHRQAGAGVAGVQRQAGEFVLGQRDAAGGDRQRVVVAVGQRRIGRDPGDGDRNCVVGIDRGLADAERDRAVLVHRQRVIGNRQPEKTRITLARRLPRKEPSE